MLLDIFEKHSSCWSIHVLKIQPQPPYGPLKGTFVNFHSIQKCYSPLRPQPHSLACTYTHTHTHTQKWFVSWKDIAYYYETIMGFSGGSNSKESICNVGDSSSILAFTRRMEDPLEKGMATHSSFLLGEFHRQRSLAGYSPWSHRVGQNWAANTFMKLL